MEAKAPVTPAGEKELKIKIVQFVNAVNFAGMTQNGFSVAIHKCEINPNKNGVVLTKGKYPQVWVPNSNIRYVEYVAQ